MLMPSSQATTWATCKQAQCWPKRIEKKTYCVTGQAFLASVAIPGCLSRGSSFSSIPDSGSQIQQQQKKKRGKKFAALPFFGGEICCPTFFVAINCTKSKTILFLKRYRKNFEPIDKEFKYF
jgi:hypothetical protein